jgi:hypothetical protein
VFVVGGELVHHLPPQHGDGLDSRMFGQGFDIGVDL